MSRASKRTSRVLFCVVLAAVALCVGAVEEYGDEDASKVLLAYEKTAFKNALTEALIEELQDAVHVRVINHSRGELADEQAAEYDAIILINSGVNSRVRPRVNAWLGDVSETEKVILLTTYRDRGWKPVYPDGVDSITSPSRKNAIDDLVEEIAEKVEQIIG